MKSGSTRTLLLATVVLLFIVFGTVAVATASEHYHVTSAGSIDVPDRTVTLDGKEFDIESVGHVSPGEAVEANVQAPEGQEHIVYLYDNEVNRIDSKQMTGDGSASFSTEGLDPGTYVLVMRAEREYQAIHPVVVAGYEPDVEVSGEMTPGEPFTVEIDAGSTQYENAPDDDSVTVVRTEDDEAVEEVEATPVDGSSVYTAELTAPDDEKEVRLLTTVLGEESLAFTSEQEMLALSETTLTEAKLDLSINQDASTAEATPEESVEVSVQAENVGDFATKQAIKLEHNGDTVDTTSIEINGSEREQITLRYTVEETDVGEGSFTVSSDDESVTHNVTITEGDTGDDTPTEQESDDEAGETPPEDDTNTTDSDGTTNETPQNNESDPDDETSPNGTTTDTDDSPNTTEPNGTDTADETSSEASGETNTSDSSGTNNTIEPNEPNESESNGSESTSEDAVPLTGFPHFIMAVLLLFAIARRRHDKT